jgi:hypothetical protein
MDQKRTGASRHYGIGTHHRRTHYAVFVIGRDGHKRVPSISSRQLAALCKRATVQDFARWYRTKIGDITGYVA